jgi:hypothetical protein
MSESKGDRPKQRRILRPVIRPSEQRYVLQQRHFAEQIEFDREQERRRIEHFERLQAVYDTSVYRNELRSLERKRFPMPWHKARLAGLRQTIAEADTQHRQSRETFAKGQEQECKALMDRQSEERAELEQEIDALPDNLRRSPVELEALERMDAAARRLGCPYCNPPRTRLRLTPL